MVHHAEHTWAGLWLKVAEAVYERHPHDFERALQLRGRNRQYIALSSETHTNSRRIGMSKYYVETNLSSVGCKLRARDLLRLFGYRDDDLEVIEE